MVSYSGLEAQKMDVIFKVDFGLDHSWNSLGWRPNKRWQSWRQSAKPSNLWKRVVNISYTKLPSRDAGSLMWSGQISSEKSCGTQDTEHRVKGTTKPSVYSHIPAVQKHLFHHFRHSPRQRRHRLSAKSVYRFPSTGTGTALLSY